jgi:hypothetical protein
MFATSFQFFIRSTAIANLTSGDAVGVQEKTRENMA